MKWDITRTWTSADPKLPLTDFRLLEPRLFWSGGLNVKRAFEGIVTYIDTESRVLWSRSGNLLNPNIFEKLVRDLAQKLKDNPTDSRSKRQRAETALNDVVNDIVEKSTNGPMPSQPQQDPNFPDPYESDGHRIFWKHSTQNGIVKIPLTNFDARIISEIREDDGVETSRVFEVLATLNGQSFQFLVPASDYAGMGWVIAHMGAEAIVSAGFGVKDHTRAAIQVLSGATPKRHVYTHTGWTQVKGEWLYLHAGGAIGPDGPVPGIEVSLPQELGLYRLPDPPDGDDLKRAVQASLNILDVAADQFTISGLAYYYRIIVDEADYSIHYAGKTGGGKSELSSLFQRHLGPEMDRLHLPATWESTDNALEGLAFACKDAVLVIDDAAPEELPSAAQQLHRRMGRIFRAQGNKQGRQRMNSDSSLRKTRPPRGGILSTGEDIPTGQSVKARVWVLEVSKEGNGAMDWAKLSQCQRDATAGLYAQAMAGFIRWLPRSTTRSVLPSSPRSKSCALRPTRVTSTAGHRKWWPTRWPAGITSWPLRSIQAQ